MREPGETRRRRRGQPLLVLVVVLAGWVGLRGSFGEAPGFLEPEPARPIARQAVLPRPAPVALGKPGEFAWHDAEMVGGRAEPAPPTALGQALRDDAMSMAVARQMLWMAALANVPLPVAMEDVSQHEAPQPVPEERELVVLGHYPQEQGQVAPRAARWSGDGWLLVRQGGGRVGAGSAPYGPTYGANQIGAVLRYRLDAEDAHKPSLFLRGYGALNGTGEGEVAFGLSGRLLPQVPVVAMIEARASHFMSGATHVRSAASLVSEIPPIRLMRGLEAETYVQAGYVGGAAHTPFIDGQMRVEHSVEHHARADVRLGMGLWGGAQEGAGRIDVGPSARVYLSQGRVGMRMAVDWRIRVAGNAAPMTGPALTLSAGF